MKSKQLLGTTLAVSLLLSACNQPSSSVSDNEISAAKQLQTLTDNTQRIAITVPGQFMVMPDAEHSGLSDAQNITLFAYNNDDDITLYVTRVGELKTTADKYFTQLGDLLRQQAGYSDIKIGIATENRMNYQFSHDEADHKVNESCMAIVEEKNLYTVCAYSMSQSFDTLGNNLKDVRITK